MMAIVDPGVRPTRLRAGVIGLGVGEAHARAYAAHPRCDLVALCDLDSARLEATARRFSGARPTSSAEELIDDPAVDLVSIATYDNFHFEQAKMALERGKHVFVEKPLCQFAEQAHELARLVRSRPGLHLSSNLVLRASPRFREVKRLLTEGRLGELYYVQSAYDYGRLHKITEGWRGELDYYSVVLGGGVHVIDLLLWLTGDRVVEVTARGNRIASRGTRFRYDDFVVATLEFESGLLGTITVNFGCTMPHFHELQLFGTSATFVNGLDEGVFFSAETREPIDAPYPGVDEGVLIGDFVESILDESEPIVSSESVFQTMAVCFAIEQAATERRAVPVQSLG
jgi:predicted dehydrogenase